MRDTTTNVDVVESFARFRYVSNRLQPKGYFDMNRNGNHYAWLAGIGLFILGGCEFDMPDENDEIDQLVDLESHRSTGSDYENEQATESDFEQLEMDATGSCTTFYGASAYTCQFCDTDPDIDTAVTFNLNGPFYGWGISHNIEPRNAIGQTILWYHGGKLDVNPKGWINGKFRIETIMGEWYKYFSLYEIRDSLKVTTASTSGGGCSW